MEQMPIMLMSTAFPKEMWAHPDLVPVFDAHIKLSRDFAKTFAEARSPIIYNCRTSR